MRDRINTILLSICLLLLVIIAAEVLSKPSVDEIDERIQFWGQHYGTHFSAR